MKTILHFRTFQKVVTWLVIISFLPSNYVFGIGNASVSPLSDRLNKTEETAIAGPIDLKELIEVNIPENFGTVKEKFKGPSDKVIVHIQDSHCNFEAQTNFAAILKNLKTTKFKDDLNLIACEGATGEIDLTPFAALDNNEVKEQLSQYYMRQGMLTGAEYYAILDKKPMGIYGIENEKLYIENYTCFLKTQYYKKDALKSLEDMKGIIKLLRGKVFGPDMLEVSVKQSEYEDGKIKFTEYCQFLRSASDKFGVNWKRYNSFKNVIESMDIEGKTDMKAVNTERAEFITLLQKKMVKEELSELVKKSLFFRIGKISATDFYTYLVDSAQKVKLDTAKYPNFMQYVRIVKIHDQINPAELFFETEQILSDIKDKAIKTANERKFDRLIKNVRTTEKLLNLELTRDDLKYFNEHRAEIDGRKFLSEINAEIARLGLPIGLSANVAKITDHIAEMEGFYKAAVERDTAIVENTLAKMVKDGQKAAVVVTGGFHSKGVMEQFKAKGISYIVVTPRMTAKYDPSVYMSRMLNEETAFEKLLQAMGTRLINVDLWAKKLIIPGGELKYTVDGKPEKIDFNVDKANAEKGIELFTQILLSKGAQVALALCNKLNAGGTLTDTEMALLQEASAAVTELAKAETPAAEEKTEEKLAAATPGEALTTEQVEKLRAKTEEKPVAVAAATPGEALTGEQEKKLAEKVRELADVDKIVKAYRNDTSSYSSGRPDFIKRLKDICLETENDEVRDRIIAEFLDGLFTEPDDYRGRGMGDYAPELGALEIGEALIAIAKVYKPTLQKMHNALKKISENKGYPSSKENAQRTAILGALEGLAGTVELSEDLLALAEKVAKDTGKSLSVWYPKLAKIATKVAMAATPGKAQEVQTAELTEDQIASLTDELNDLMEATQGNADNNILELRKICEKLQKSIKGAKFPEIADAIAEMNYLDKLARENHMESLNRILFNLNDLQIAAMRNSNAKIAAQKKAEGEAAAKIAEEQKKHARKTKLIAAVRDLNATLADLQGYLRDAVAFNDAALIGEIQYKILEKKIAQAATVADLDDCMREALSMQDAGKKNGFINSIQLKRPEVAAREQQRQNKLFQVITVMNSNNLKGYRFLQDYMMGDMDYTGLINALESLMRPMSNRTKQQAYTGEELMDFIRKIYAGMDSKNADAELKGKLADVLSAAVSTLTDNISRNQFGLSKPLYNLTPADAQKLYVFLGECMKYMSGNTDKLAKIEAVMSNVRPLLKNVPGLDLADFDKASYSKVAGSEDVSEDEKKLIWANVVQEIKTQRVQTSTHTNAKYKDKIGAAVGDAGFVIDANATTNNLIVIQDKNDRNNKREMVLIRASRAALNGRNAATYLVNGRYYVVVADDLFDEYGEELQGQVAHEIIEGVLGKTHAEAVAMAGEAVLTGDVDRAMKTYFETSDPKARESAQKLIMSYARVKTFDAQNEARYAEELKDRYDPNVDKRAAYGRAVTRHMLQQLGLRVLDPATRQNALTLLGIIAEDILLKSLADPNDGELMMLFKLLAALKGNVPDGAFLAGRLFKMLSADGKMQNSAILLGFTDLKPEVRQQAAAYNALNRLFDAASTFSLAELTANFENAYGGLAKDDLEMMNVDILALVKSRFYDNAKLLDVILATQDLDLMKDASMEYIKLENVGQAYNILSQYVLKARKANREDPEAQMIVKRLGQRFGLVEGALPAAETTARRELVQARMTAIQKGQTTAAGETLLNELSNEDILIDADMHLPLSPDMTCYAKLVKAGVLDATDFRAIRDLPDDAAKLRTFIERLAGKVDACQRQRSLSDMLDRLIKGSDPLKLLLDRKYAGEARARYGQILSSLVVLTNKYFKNQTLYGAEEKAVKGLKKELQEQMRQASDTGYTMNEFYQDGYIKELLMDFLDVVKKDGFDALVRTQGAKMHDIALLYAKFFGKKTSKKPFSDLFYGLTPGVTVRGGARVALAELFERVSGIPGMEAPTQVPQMPSYGVQFVTAQQLLDLTKGVPAFNDYFEIDIAKGRIIVKDAQNRLMRHMNALTIGNTVYLITGTDEGKGKVNRGTALKHEINEIEYRGQIADLLDVDEDGNPRFAGALTPAYERLYAAIQNSPRGENLKGREYRDLFPEEKKTLAFIVKENLRQAAHNAANLINKDEVVKDTTSTSSMSYAVSLINNADNAASAGREHLLMNMLMFSGTGLAIAPENQKAGALAAEAGSFAGEVKDGIASKLDSMIVAAKQEFDVQLKVLDDATNDPLTRLRAAMYFSETDFSWMDEIKTLPEQNRSFFELMFPKEYQDPLRIRTMAREAVKNMYAELSRSSADDTQTYSNASQVLDMLLEALRSKELKGELMIDLLDMFRASVGLTGSVQKMLTMRLEGRKHADALRTLTAKQIKDLEAAIKADDLALTEAMQRAPYRRGMTEAEAQKARNPMLEATLKDLKELKEKRLAKLKKQFADLAEGTILVDQVRIANIENKAKELFAMSENSARLAGLDGSQKRMLRQVGARLRAVYALGLAWRLSDKADKTAVMEVFRGLDMYNPSVMKTVCDELIMNSGQYTALIGILNTLAKEETVWYQPLYYLRVASQMGVEGSIPGRPVVVNNVFTVILQDPIFKRYQELVRESAAEQGAIIGQYQSYNIALDKYQEKLATERKEALAGLNIGSGTMSEQDMNAKIAPEVARAEKEPSRALMGTYDEKGTKFQKGSQKDLKTASDQSFRELEAKAKGGDPQCGNLIRAFAKIEEALGKEEWEALKPFIARILITGDKDFIDYSSTDNYLLAHPGKRSGTIYLPQGLWNKLQNDPVGLATLIVHEATHIKSFWDFKAKNPDMSPEELNKAFLAQAEGEEAKAEKAENDFIAKAGGVNNLRLFQGKLLGDAALNDGNYAEGVRQYYNAVRVWRDALRKGTAIDIDKDFLTDLLRNFDFCVIAVLDGSKDLKEEAVNSLVTLADITGFINFRSGGRTRWDKQENWQAITALRSKISALLENYKKQGKTGEKQAQLLARALFRLDMALMTHPSNDSDKNADFRDKAILGVSGSVVGEFDDAETNAFAEQLSKILDETIYSVDKQVIASLWNKPLFDRLPADVKVRFLKNYWNSVIASEDDKTKARQILAEASMDKENTTLIINMMISTSNPSAVNAAWTALLGNDNLAGVMPQLSPDRVGAIRDRVIADINGALYPIEIVLVGKNLIDALLNRMDSGAKRDFIKNIFQGITADANKPLTEPNAAELKLIQCADMLSNLIEEGAKVNALSDAQLLDGGIFVLENLQKAAASSAGRNILDKVIKLYVKSSPEVQQKYFNRLQAISGKYPAVAEKVNEAAAPAVTRRVVAFLNRFGMKISGEAQALDVFKSFVGRLSPVVGDEGAMLEAAGIVNAADQKFSQIQMLALLNGLEDAKDRKKIEMMLKGPERLAQYAAGRASVDYAATPGESLSDQEKADLLKQLEGYDDVTLLDKAEGLPELLGASIIIVNGVTSFPVGTSGRTAEYVRVEKDGKKFIYVAGGITSANKEGLRHDITEINIENAELQRAKEAFESGQEYKINGMVCTKENYRAAIAQYAHSRAILNEENGSWMRGRGGIGIPDRVLRALMSSNDADYLDRLARNTEAEIMKIRARKDLSLDQQMALQEMANAVKLAAECRLAVLAFTKTSNPAVLYAGLQALMNKNDTALLVTILSKALSGLELKGADAAVIDKIVAEAALVGGARDRVQSRAIISDVMKGAGNVYTFKLGGETVKMSLKAGADAKGNKVEIIDEVVVNGKSANEAQKRFIALMVGLDKGLIDEWKQKPIFMAESDTGLLDAIANILAEGGRVQDANILLNMVYVNALFGRSGFQKLYDDINAKRASNVEGALERMRRLLPTKNTMENVVGLLTWFYENAGIARDRRDLTQAIDILKPVMMRLIDESQTPAQLDSLAEQIEAGLKGLPEAEKNKVRAFANGILVAKGSQKARDAVIRELFTDVTERKTLNMEELLKVAEERFQTMCVMPELVAAGVVTEGQGKENFLMIARLYEMQKSEPDRFDNLYRKARDSDRKKKMLLEEVSEEELQPGLMPAFSLGYAATPGEGLTKEEQEQLKAWLEAQTITGEISSTVDYHPIKNKFGLPAKSKNVRIVKLGVDTIRLPNGRTTNYARVSMPDGSTVIYVAGDVREENRDGLVHDLTEINVYGDKMSAALAAFKAGKSFTFRGQTYPSMTLELQREIERFAHKKAMLAERLTRLGVSQRVFDGISESTDTAYLQGLIDGETAALEDLEKYILGDERSAGDGFTKDEIDLLKSMAKVVTTIATARLNMVKALKPEAEAAVAKLNGSNIAERVRGIRRNADGSFTVDGVKYNVVTQTKGGRQYVTKLTTADGKEVTGAVRIEKEMLIAQASADLGIPKIWASTEGKDLVLDAIGAMIGRGDIAGAEKLLVLSNLSVDGMLGRIEGLRQRISEIKVLKGLEADIGRLNKATEIVNILSAVKGITDNSRMSVDAKRRAEELANRQIAKVLGGITTEADLNAADKMLARAQAVATGNIRDIINAVRFTIEQQRAAVRDLNIKKRELFPGAVLTTESKWAEFLESLKTPSEALQPILQAAGISSEDMSSGNINNLATQMKLVDALLTVQASNPVFARELIRTVMGYAATPGEGLTKEELYALEKEIDRYEAEGQCEDGAAAYKAVFGGKELPSGVTIRVINGINSIQVGVKEKGRTTSYVRKGNTIYIAGGITPQNREGMVHDITEIVAVKVERAKVSGNVYAGETFKDADAAYAAADRFAHLQAILAEDEGKWMSGTGIPSRVAQDILSRTDRGDLKKWIDNTDKEKERIDKTAGLSDDQKNALKKMADMMKEVAQIRLAMLDAMEKKQVADMMTALERIDAAGITTGAEQAFGDALLWVMKTARVQTNVKNVKRIDEKIVIKVGGREYEVIQKEVKGKNLVGFVTRGGAAVEGYENKLISVLTAVPNFGERVSQSQSITKVLATADDDALLTAIDALIREGGQKSLDKANELISIYKNAFANNEAIDKLANKCFQVGELLRYEKELAANKAPTVGGILSGMQGAASLMTDQAFKDKVADLAISKLQSVISAKLTPKELNLIEDIIAANEVKLCELGVGIVISNIRAILAARAKGNSSLFQSLQNKWKMALFDNSSDSDKKWKLLLDKLAKQQTPELAAAAEIVAGVDIGSAEGQMQILQNLLRSKNADSRKMMEALSKVIPGMAVIAAPAVEEVDLLELVNKLRRAILGFAATPGESLTDEEIAELVKWIGAQQQDDMTAEYNTKYKGPGMPDLGGAKIVRLRGVEGALPIAKGRTASYVRIGNTIYVAGDIKDTDLQGLVHDITEISEEEEVTKAVLGEIAKIGEYIINCKKFTRDSIKDTEQMKDLAKEIARLAHKKAILAEEGGKWTIEKGGPGIPKRVLDAILNSRDIGWLDRLIDGTDAAFDEVFNYSDGQLNAVQKSALLQMALKIRSKALQRKADLEANVDIAATANALMNYDAMIKGPGENIVITPDSKGYVVGGVEYTIETYEKDGKKYITKVIDRKTRKEVADTDGGEILKLQLALFSRKHARETAEQPLYWQATGRQQLLDMVTSLIDAGELYNAEKMLGACENVFTDTSGIDTLKKQLADKKKGQLAKEEFNKSLAWEDATVEYVDMIASNMTDDPDVTKRANDRKIEILKKALYGKDAKADEKFNVLMEVLERDFAVAATEITKNIDRSHAAAFRVAVLQYILNNRENTVVKKLLGFIDDLVSGKSKVDKLWKKYNEIAVLNYAETPGESLTKEQKDKILDGINIFESLDMISLLSEDDVSREFGIPVSDVGNVTVKRVRNMKYFDLGNNRRANCIRLKDRAGNVTIYVCGDDLSRHKNDLIHDLDEINLERAEESKIVQNADGTKTYRGNVYNVSQEAEAIRLEMDLQQTVHRLAILKEDGGAWWQAGGTGVPTRIFRSIMDSDNMQWLTDLIVDQGKVEDQIRNSNLDQAQKDALLRLARNLSALAGLKLKLLTRSGMYPSPMDKAANARMSDKRLQDLMTGAVMMQSDITLETIGTWLLANPDLLQDVESIIKVYTDAYRQAGRAVNVDAIRIRLNSFMDAYRNVKLAKDMGSLLSALTAYADLIDGLPAGTMSDKRYDKRAMAAAVLNRLDSVMLPFDANQLKLIEQVVRRAGNRFPAVTVKALAKIRARQRDIARRNGTETFLVRELKKTLYPEMGDRIRFEEELAAAGTVDMKDKQRPAGEQLELLDQKAGERDKRDYITGMENILSPAQIKSLQDELRKLKPAHFKGIMGVDAGFTDAASINELIEKSPLLVYMNLVRMGVLSAEDAQFENIEKGLKAQFFSAGKNSMEKDREYSEKELKDWLSTLKLSQSEIDKIMRDPAMLNMIAQGFKAANENSVMRVSLGNLLALGPNLELMQKVLEKMGEVVPTAYEDYEPQDETLTKEEKQKMNLVRAWAGRQAQEGRKVVFVENDKGKDKKAGASMKTKVANALDAKGVKGIDLARARLFLTKNEIKDYYQMEELKQIAMVIISVEGGKQLVLSEQERKVLVNAGIEGIDENTVYLLPEIKRDGKLYDDLEAATSSTEFQA